MAILSIRRTISTCTVLAAAALAAACSSGYGGGSSANGSAHYLFYDTGPLNSANPSAPSTISAGKLSQLGPVPHLTSNVKVGVLLKALTNQYWQQVEAGLVQAKSDFGAQTSDIQSATSENATSEQLQICETMLQQGYNAFVISPETTSNLNPCLKTMKQRNIPVVNIEAPGSGLPTSVYVGPPLIDDGQLAGGYLVKHLPAGSKVALIEGLPGSSASDMRKQGFDSALKGSELNVVADVAGNWDEQTAYNETLQILSRYPDIKGIYAANDQMSTAVVKAVSQAGKQGKVTVVGTDGIPLAVSDITSGTQTATVTPFPFYEGYWALESAIRLLGGQKVPAWVEVNDVVITQQNVGHYFKPSGVAKPGLFH